MHAGLEPEVIDGARSATQALLGSSVRPPARGPGPQPGSGRAGDSGIGDSRRRPEAGFLALLIPGKEGMGTDRWTRSAWNVHPRRLDNSHRERYFQRVGRVYIAGRTNPAASLVIGRCHAYPHVSHHRGWRQALAGLDTLPAFPDKLDQDEQPDLRVRP